MKRWATSLLLCVTAGAMAGAVKAAPETPPDSVLEYRGDGQGTLDRDAEDFDVRAEAVKDAARRYGAMSAHKEQAKAHNARMEALEEVLDKTFDFEDLLMPEGYLPPVVARSDDVVRVSGDGRSRMVSARVFRVLRDARFSMGRPTWREYLMEPVVEPEEPAREVANWIDDYPDEWEAGVRRGWEAGREAVRKSIERGIYELRRDYLGMTLFHRLHLEGLVEAPKVTEETESVAGGGPGRDAMDVGRQRVVITEDVYFVPDTDEWRALPEPEDVDSELERFLGPE